MLTPSYHHDPRRRNDVAATRINQQLDTVVSQFRVWVARQPGQMNGVRRAKLLALTIDHVTPIVPVRHVHIDTAGDMVVVASGAGGDELTLRLALPDDVAEKVRHTHASALN